jgi:DNA-binding beta-propeller fold protein YncE
MAVNKDGGRVYVGIAQAPGGVDVIDTASMQRVKTVPTEGTIHNAYITPDGRFVVAGFDSRSDDQRGTRLISPGCRDDSPKDRCCW